MPSPVNLSQMPTGKRLLITEAGLADTRRRVAGHTQRLNGLDGQLAEMKATIEAQPKSQLNEQMVHAVHKVIADVERWRANGMTDEFMKKLADTDLKVIAQYVDRLSALEHEVYDYHRPAIDQLQQDVGDLQEDHSLSEYVASQAYAIARSASGSIGKAFRNTAITITLFAIVAGLGEYFFITMRHWKAETPHQVGAIAIVAGIGALIGMFAASFQDETAADAEAAATAFVAQRKARVEKRQAQRAPLAPSDAELDAVRVTPTATAGSTPDASSGPFVAAGASSTASARS